MDCSPPGYRGPWDFPGKKYWRGLLFLLQGIFSTQGLAPHLLHCRQIPYCCVTRETFIFNTVCQTVLKNGSTKCSTLGIHVKHLFPLFQHSVLADSKNFTNIMDMKLVSTNTKIKKRLEFVKNNNNNI